MLDLEFWGEPISIYTDSEAQDDGILTDISDLGVEFNGKIINRIAVGAVLATGLREMQPEAAKHNLQLIAANSTFDGDGADAWGIFQPHAKLGNEKLWLVPNEVEGYSMLLPAEY